MMGMVQLRRYDPADRIREEIESDRCIPLEIHVIGEDPGTRAIRSVVALRYPESMYCHGVYAVLDYFDYTVCPDARSRQYGLYSETVRSEIGRTEAVLLASQRAGELLANYTWFTPGTEELVPGCWGYME